MPGTELLRIQGQRKTSSLTLRSLNLSVVGRQKKQIRHYSTVVKCSDKGLYNCYCGTEEGNLD